MDRKYKKISLHYLHYGGESAESAMQKNDMRKVRILRIPTIISANFYEDQKRTRLEREGTKKDASEKNSMYPKGFYPIGRRPVPPVIGDTSGYMLIKRVRGKVSIILL